MNSADVLIMTTDAGAVEAVRSVLAARPAGKAPVVCANVAELRNRLGRSPVNGTLDVAMVDIDSNPAGALADLSKVMAAHPRTRFMVLSTDCSERLMLQAMQAGARHFLRKESIALELDGILERLLSYEPQTTARLGHVISVFSCSGGCGATTVAVNLANELRLLSSECVLIVDLDPHYGSVASHLGLSGNYGIAHILNRGSAVDDHLIRTGAVGFIQGLDVLLSPAAAPADAALPMKWENLVRTTEACRESYRYVVIDAPRAPEPVMTDLASLSRIAVIVFQLTIHDIALAKATISRLSHWGMGLERIVPLANRVRRRGPLLSLQEGRRAMGLPSLCGIRNDWRRAIKSVERGQPLAETAGRSGLRADFRRLALQLHTQTSKATQENQGGDHSV